jgi:predicted TIM-barrel fold metal-dependent hydrolase
VLIGTHTGYPWVEEMIAVATKWPNVYINVAAWMPKYFGPNLVRFMGGRAGHTKVMFGSNGLDWARYLREFNNLDLPEDRVQAMLWGNAKRVHKLP